MTTVLAQRLTQDIVAVRVPLPRQVPPILAVGAFLKNTLCLMQDHDAMITPDVGNLETLEAVRGFGDYAKQLLTMVRGLPIAVAHDLHPDFHSTRYAQNYGAQVGVPVVAVQHHHAHVAAVMAEHGCEEPTLGLALDGFGLGPDNGSWGGELLLVDADGYRRLGRLASLPQPGGDRAAREPWRMAAAALFVLGRGDEIAGRFAGMGGAEVIGQMLRRNVNCPTTSSCGRLFDAACGLLGVKPVAAFEGEAPMELERLGNHPVVAEGGWQLQDGVLDLLPLLDRLTGLGAEDGANLFHGTLAAAMVQWVEAAAEVTGLRRVVFSGGCFLNQVLSAGLLERLDDRGYEVLQPIRLKPGDSAISLGQAWVVAMARS